MKNLDNSFEMKGTRNEETRQDRKSGSRDYVYRVYRFIFNIPYCNSVGIDYWENMI